MNLPQLAVPKHFRLYAILFGLAVLFYMLVMISFSSRLREARQETQISVRAQATIESQLTRIENQLQDLGKAKPNNQDGSLASNGSQAPVGTPAPTLTPRPTPTPLPEPTDTPADMVLDPQRIWREQGVELVLLDDYEFKINEKQLHVNFKFKNDTGQNLLLRFGIDNFSAHDNLGNRLKILGIWRKHRNNPLIDYYNQIELLLDPGQEIKNTNVPHPLRIEIDSATMCDVEEITFIATNISRIDEAKWRIPVNIC